MKIEVWDGMPPTDNGPGLIWYHATVVDPKGHVSGVHFEASPVATENELRNLASAKWSQVQAVRQAGARAN